MLLSVEDLHVSFETGDGRLQAVRGVSFDLDEGETLGVVGESGSGKSVSTQAMVGLARGAQVSGQARFKGRDMLTMSEPELRGLRGKDIGMIFQDPLSSQHPQFRVGAQIAEAIRAHEPSSPKLLRSRVIDVLAEVGIPNPERRVDDYPHQFSGGMRQRMMIGMALALRPALLVADEPTTALDVTVQAQILELMKRMQEEHGTAILMITHDLGVVARVADRVMTMYSGSIVEKGLCEEVLETPHHPYTRGLLASVPRLGSRGTKLQSIPGNPPSLLAERRGCAFAPRCSSAVAACLVEPPPVRHINAGHTSSCVLPVTAASPVKLAKEPAIVASHTAEGTLASITNLQVAFRGARKGLLGLHRDTVVAVDDVSLEIPTGTTVGIVGESGSGKSTLARALTGLIPANGGRVEFEGKDISALSREEMQQLRRQVQLIFQDPYSSLNPQRRVGSIIADPLVIHKAVKRGEEKARVQELMELVGLNPEHYNRFPAEFSGGQRQRIGIARALALNPKLVVCDEPVSALDVSIQAQILNLLASLQAELGLTYVFIAHDLAVVEHIADSVAVMYRGKIVEQGSVEDVYHSPRHSYTRSLLAAGPHIETVQLEVVEGYHE